MRFISGPAVGVLTLSAALGISGGARAQAVQAAAPATALSPVIVTAERREQAAQDVGVAISVLSGPTLALRGVTTLETLQYQTPGLEVTPQFGTGQPGFRLRGVGFDDYAANNASPVGIYIDEVALPFPVQTTGQIFDVARVEVLRGPQGTLYGRNSTGGAINIVTNRPTSSIAAGLDAEYGSYGYGRSEGYLSGPLTDTLKFRVSAIAETGGGFQRNRVTGQEIGYLYSASGRLQLQRDPNTRFSARVEAAYGYDYSDGQGLYRFDAGLGQPADRNPYLTGWGASPAFARLAGITPDTKPFRHNENYGIDLHASYDLGFAKLTSITGYHQLTRREYEDFDGTAAADADEEFNTRAKVLSEEVRLNSERAGRLKWQGGAYYSKEDLGDTFLSDFIDYPGLGLTADTRYLQHAYTIAGFGQLDYRITDRLSFTGGLRLEHERRSLDDFSTTAPSLPTDPVFASLAAESIAYTRLSGKAEADYRIAPRVLVYASASHGVKSGGFTAVNTTRPDQLAPFKPESLWAYETGIKSQVLGDTLRVNLDGFYYDYRDEQQQGAVFDSFSQGPIGKIVNVPKSHIYGAEGEVDWRPVPQLEVSQSVSLARGEFDDYEGLDTAASTLAKAAVYDNRDGQDLGFPKWSLNGSASYTQPVLGGYQLMAEADYAYRDKLMPVLLGSQFNVASYWLANATLTFSPADGPWSLGLYGRNITGTRYDLTRNFFLPGVDIAAPGAPATFGGRVTYRY